jgi:hypothetical protein
MRYHATIIMAFLCAFALAAVAAPHARTPAPVQQAAPALPFNDSNSSQAFQKNQSGGIQQLVANDPKDQALIAAIRAQLEAQAARFGQGDYSGIVKISGKDIPAGQYLSAKAGQIGIIYRNVPAGAAIDYQGRDAAAVAAIHDWFDAQLSADD